MGTTQLRYVPALDGLRGLAVLAVLLFHADVSWASGGFLGVSTFFTLSGFLITTLLVSEQQFSGKVSLRAFWIRRVRRLLPASLVTLVVIVAISPLLGTTADPVRLPGDVLAAASYVANWRFVAAGTSYADLFVAPSLVQHFWSLAIEEQFYLLFPLVAAAALRFRGPRALGVAAASGLGFSMLVTLGAGFSNDRIYYGTDTRAAELLVGVLLAVVWHHPSRAALSSRIPALPVCVAAGALLALLGSFTAWITLTLQTDVLYRGGFILYALLSSAVIAGAMLPPTSSPVAALLSVMPFRSLGRISYGAYLIHWPLFLVLDPTRTGIDGTALVVVRLGMTLALAYLSYGLIESPIRAGRLVPDRFVLPMVPAAVAVLLLTFTVFPAEQPVGSQIVFAEESAPPPTAPESVVVPASYDQPPRAVAPEFQVLIVGTTDSYVVAESLRGVLDGRPDVSASTALAACGSSRAASDVAFTTELETCGGWVEEWGPAVLRQPAVVVVLQPLRHTALLGLTDAILRRDAGAVVDLLTSTGAKLIPVTLPGETLQPFDVTLRAVAADAGADAGAVDIAESTDLITAIADGVITRRPAPEQTALAGTEPRPAPTANRKVMIVGDSVASNLGRALELWGRRTGTATTWNAAALGCGLAAGGVTNAQPPHNVDSAKCTEWRASWQQRVDDFRPDVVVVLSGPWDLPDRRLPEWAEPENIGQPAFDAWLLSQYQAAQVIFASRGAKVVWLTTPCTGAVWAGFAIANTGAFDNARIDQLNTGLLPQLQGVRIVDLHAVACPGGVFAGILGGVEGSRPDGLHFVEAAAIWVADQIGPLIMAAE